MATTATAAPGKTSFVKEFLHGNPQANAKAVNEAWQAAGMKGTISHPIISQVRKQLGLTGNLPGKTRNAAKEKAASNMPRTVTPTPGKTSFVKDFLNANPQGNTKDVNEAWQAAGFEGTISPTLVNKTRVKMNLTGNLRGNSKTAAKGEAAPRHAQDGNRFSRQVQLLERVPPRQSPRQRQSGQRGVDGSRIRRDHQRNPRLQGESIVGTNGQPWWEDQDIRRRKGNPHWQETGKTRKEPTAPVTGQPRGRKSARTLALTDLEIDIDRLIFKVMGVGDLTQIEDSLRQARRQLYATADER